MFWFILVAIVVFALIIWTLKGSKNSDEDTATPVAQWREPRTNMEYFVFFIIMCDALSRSHESNTLFVKWKHGKDTEDEVAVSFYGVDRIGDYQNTEEWKFFKSLSCDGSSLEYKMVFGRDNGGVPACFRTEEELFSYVNRFSANAQIQKTKKDSLIQETERLMGKYEEGYMIAFDGCKLLNGISSQKLSEIIVNAYSRI